MRWSATLVRLFQNLLCCGLLVAPVFAAKGELSWHDRAGQVVKGRPVGTVGDLLMVSRGDGIRFLSPEYFTDEEIDQVVTFRKQTGDGTGIWAKSDHAVSKALRKRLKVVEGKKLVPLDVGQRKEPRFFLIYFSAGWCPPCHRFTPVLVQAYQGLKERLGEDLELVFVSSDRSAGEQTKYAVEYSMPWPILEYGSIGLVPVVERWAGQGIPCLVLVTNSGEAVFHSFRGDQYLGPGSVLENLGVLEAALARDGIRNPGMHRVDLRVYLNEHRQGDADAEPYFVGLDAEHFQGLTMPDFKVAVDVDERGHVSNFEMEESGPRSLEQIVRTEAENWRFFPKLVGGKPVSGRTQVTVSATHLLRARRSGN